MPIPAPDRKTIDDWLAGVLPPKRAAEIECYFEEHPGEIDDEVDDEIQAFGLSLFRGLSSELDPADAAMIARVKSGLAHGPGSPREGAWKEILAPADRKGLLGILGDYEVSAVIASGGMATVFKGYDPVLDRHAALKALSPEMAANATARERFLREARAAARLEHEKVLPVYGVHEGAVPWFAMRYVEGETLQERIDRGVVFSADALKSIARQMASALEAAHAEGIVHRDIKPANVIFDGDSDRLWVCDFGIAQCSGDPSLTYPGAIAGTPHFMSPEQARGEEVDGRSDLFSLGAVLHCAATGRHPFAGATTAAVLRGVQEDVPAPMKRPEAAYPRWLRELVGALLEKERDRRPGSAAEVIACLAEERTGDRRAISRRRRRAGWTVLSAAALAGTAALIPWTPVRDLLPDAGRSRPDLAALAVSVNRSDETGTVELAATGEIFATLREAFAATSGSATFLLRGRLECPETLYSANDQEIHLLAAPGASPVVVATHRDDHALFLAGPTRISGIRFERGETGVTSLPIVGFLSDEHEVVVEDCVFSQRAEVDGRRNLSPALGITGTKRAVVRRCLFQGGSGLWLAFVEHRGVPEAEIRVADCVFDNSQGLRLFSWVPGDRGLSLRMERCVGLLDDFAELVEGSGRMRASFDLRDSLMDVRDSAFRTQAPSLAAILDRLEWTGRGNVFRAGVPAAATASSQGMAAPGLREDLLATGRAVEFPIDRAALGESPVGMAEWREALSSEAPAAARNTLGLFIR